jgi:hypothetical protein
MMTKVYGAIGGFILLAFLSSHAFGWTLFDSHEEHETPSPKSIRDNPGAYRAHYVGGK